MSEIDSVIDLVIEEVKAVRKEKHRAWIFNEDGEISENAIVADVIPYLKDLKEYEVILSDEEIEELKNAATEHIYTYNWNGNVSNDVCLFISEDKKTVVFYVHLCGDARENFSLPFVCKFNHAEEYFALEHATQMKDITDNLTADMCIFHEGVVVFDNEKQEEIGTFYESDKEELLKEIEKNA